MVNLHRFKTWWRRFREWLPDPDDFLDGTDGHR